MSEEEAIRDCVRDLNKHELRASLIWHRDNAEHCRDTGDHRAYVRHLFIVAAICEELAKRKGVFVA